MGLTNGQAHARGIEWNTGRTSHCGRGEAGRASRRCAPLPAWIVKLYGGRALPRVFELLDTSLEQSDVLLEETRPGHLGSRGVLTVVGSVVSYAPATRWLVAVASLSGSSVEGPGSKTSKLRIPPSIFGMANRLRPY